MTAEKKGIGFGGCLHGTDAEIPSPLPSPHHAFCRNPSCFGAGLNAGLLGRVVFQLWLVWDLCNFGRRSVRSCFEFFFFLVVVVCVWWVVLGS